VRLQNCNIAKVSTICSLLRIEKGGRIVQYNSAVNEMCNKLKYCGCIKISAVEFCLFFALIAEYLTGQLVVVKKNSELCTFVSFHLSL